MYIILASSLSTSFSFTNEKIILIKKKRSILDFKIELGSIFGWIRQYEKKKKE